MAPAATMARVSHRWELLRVAARDWARERRRPSFAGVARLASSRGTLEATSLMGWLFTFSDPAPHRQGREIGFLSGHPFVAVWVIPPISPTGPASPIPFERLAAPLPFGSPPPSC